MAQQETNRQDPCCFETHIIPDDDDSLQDPDSVESPQIEEPSTFTLQQHGGPATRAPKKPPNTDATITMP